MARIAGLAVERTMTGKPIFGRVDFRKHPDMIPIFEEKEAEFEKKKESKPPRGYMTHDEFVDRCNSAIDIFCRKHGIL